MADINGTTASENLPGTSSTDTIDFSQGGNDTVTAGNGDDTLVAGAALTAADRLNGGANYDTLFLDGNYSAGVTLAAETLLNIEEIVFANQKSYRFTSNDGNVAAGEGLTVNARSITTFNTLYWDGSAETNGAFVFLDGVSGDTLIGGQQGDQFFVSGGAEVIDGQGGSDRIDFAGSGFSTAAVIDGGDGFDVLGLDGLYASQVILGSHITSIERVQLNGAFDYNVRAENGLLAAGQSMVITNNIAAGFELTFYGALETEGAFEIYGSLGNDNITGGQGNDYIVLDNGGVDRVIGAGGDDGVSFFDTWTSADFVNGGTGTDSVSLEVDTSAGLTLGSANFVSVERLTLLGDFNHRLTPLDSLVASGVMMEIVAPSPSGMFGLTFDGSAETNGAYRVTGGFGVDNLLGGAGADSLSGGAGSDTLSGGAGIDTLFGGFGNDVFIYTPGDVLQEDGSGGVDRVLSATTVSLAAQGLQFIENVTLTGTANANATGNSDANVLTGNGGNNILNGGGAADTMIGGGGNDIYYVENIGDVTTELAGGGIDLVSSSVSHTLKSNIENLNLNGSAAVPVNGSGNTLSNIINGNSGNNYLRGFEGADTLNGGTGSDTLQGGTASDRLNPGNDIDFDNIRFSAVADSTGSQRDIVTGMDLAAEDAFDFPTVPTSIAFVNAGTLNLATINANLATAVDAAMAANGAVLFDPTAGDLNVAGHSFLVVDANGDGVYKPNQDYVVELVNFSGTLTLEDFL